MTTPRLVRPRYFIWLVVPASFYAVFLAFGLPHLLWSYDWRAMGPDSHSDFSQRYYTRCTYAGPYGAMTIHPSKGVCGIILFAKSGGA